MGEGQMMTHPIGDEPLDIPKFRERIAKYSDEHLLRCGRAAAYMASPAAHYGPVMVTYIQQLEELRAEWRRRRTLKNEEACEKNEKEPHGQRT
jgi:hypothetical protein